MKEIITKSYQAEDGTIFEDENACRDYEKKEFVRKNREAMFALHFIKVDRVSDALNNYVTGINGYYTYVFIAFDNWREVLEADGVDTFDTFTYTNGVEIGKKYYLFYADDNWVYIVDPENLRTSILDDLEHLEKEAH